MQGGRPAGNGSGKPQTRMVIADAGRSSTGSRGLIDVVGFVIDVGELPCGGAVEFECLRLDL